MEVVVTTWAIRHAKLQSNRHHQQTNSQLFTGWMPFLSPNQQCQSTEGKYHIRWTWSPQDHLVILLLICSHHSMSVRPSVCPSLCLSVCPSLCLSVRPSVRLLFCLSVCLLQSHYVRNCTPTLLFAVKATDVGSKVTKSTQLVNHFGKASTFTTKVCS